MRALIRAGQVRSAPDCREGGFAVALADCCFHPASSLGAQIDLSAARSGRLDEILFNESQSRVVISTMPENAEAVLQSAAAAGVSAPRRDAAGGDELGLAVAGETLRWPIHKLHDDWHGAIARALGEETK